MCAVLLHHNPAVRDRSLPNVDWKGRCSLQQTLQCFPTRWSQGMCCPPRRRQRTHSAVLYPPWFLELAHGDIISTHCDGIFNVAAVIGQLFSTILGPAYIPLLSHPTAHRVWVSHRLSSAHTSMEWRENRNRKWSSPASLPQGWEANIKQMFWIHLLFQPSRSVWI